MYRQLQAFNRELESLKNAYWVLLPSTPAPTFEIRVAKKTRSRDPHNSFAELYGWALTGFKSVIDECRKRKQNGVPWRDHSRAHAGWKEIDRQVENALNSINGTPDFKAVLRVGEKALRMLDGFASSKGKLNGWGPLPSVYDNPARPPDFDHLRQSFALGRVVIRVEPSKPATHNKQKKKKV
jgi:hypothetical protein